MPEKDKVGRIIITYDHTGQANIDLRIHNLPPLLALGLMTLCYERLKNQVLAGSVSPVVVPRMREIPRA